MSFLLDYSNFQNLDNLLRYQNHLLIRKIAQDKNWPLAELKKFVPAKVDINYTSSNQTKKLKAKSKPSKSTDSPNFKVIQKKVVKKKVKKSTPPKKSNTITKKETPPSNDNTLEPLKGKKKVKKIVRKKKEEVAKPKEEIKPLGDGEVEVMLIEIEECIYYLDPKTDKVYEKDESGYLNFVGMKEGDRVNLDAESAEE